VRQFRILHKRDKFYPQQKGWWKFWTWFVSDDGSIQRFSSLNECADFLERQAHKTTIIHWEPKCKL